MASVIAGMWGARRDHALVSCTFLNGQVGEVEYTDYIFQNTKTCNTAISPALLLVPIHHVRHQPPQERPRLNTPMSPGEALTAPIGEHRVQRCADPGA